MRKLGQYGSAKENNLLLAERLRKERQASGAGGAGEAGGEKKAYPNRIASWGGQFLPKDCGKPRSSQGDTRGDNTVRLK
ncbi:MAG: hypothetical protein ACREPR_01905 [Brasilonema sp.]